MAIQKTISSFSEGLLILQQVNDFATLRDTINEMIAIVPPDKLHIARESIAQVIRRKQAQEMQDCCAAFLSCTPGRSKGSSRATSQAPIV